MTNIQLFKCNDFVSLSNNETRLILSKIDEKNKYSPEQGSLLKDVNIYKNVELGSIHITGKCFNIFKPHRNMMLSIFSLVNLEIMKRYIDIKEDDIVYKLGKYAIIKRQYYHLLNPTCMDRCYFNTPIIILNCNNEVENAT